MIYSLCVCLLCRPVDRSQYFQVHLRQARLRLCTMTTVKFDCRHGVCIYYQDWNRVTRAKPAEEGKILPGVSRAASAQFGATPDSAFSSPRNTLSSSSGVVVAVNEALATLTGARDQAPQYPRRPSAGLPFDEEAKLVYGVMLSLRNMVKKISGRYVATHMFSPLTLCTERSTLQITARRHTNSTCLRH